MKRGKVECRVSLNRTAPGADGARRRRRRAWSSSRSAARDVARQVAGRRAAVGRRDPALARRAGRADASRPRSSRSARRRWSAQRARRARARRARAKAPSSRRCWRSAARRSRSQVARVAPRIPAIHAAYVEKLAARLREAGLDPDQDRLKQELALFATKVDVAEELPRLTTHVAEVRRVLGAGGSAGKRLDFLMQELHREANTLGSKSVDAELSQASLELKVLIEQMREQVQNLE